MSLNKRPVVLLSAGHAVTDINQGAIPALLPFLIAEHGFSYAAAAGIVFAANVASTVIQPLFGHAADKISKPWLMPLGLLLAGLGLAVTGYLDSYGLIIAAAVVSGIGVAAYHPEAARMVSLAAGGKRATAMSIFGVGGTLGFAIGPAFMTAALINFGLKGTISLAFPVGLMALIIVTQQPYLSRLEKAGQEKRAQAGPSGLGDAWWPFGRLTVTVIARSILFYGLNTFIPLYFINGLNQSKAVGATALTIMAGSAVVGNLLGGPLADRFGHRRLLLIGFLILIPLLPLLKMAQSPLLAILVLAPIGVSLALTYSPAVVLGQRYLPNRVGLSSGVTLGIAVAVGGIATPFLGRLADLHGLGAVLTGLAALPLLGTALALTLPKPEAS